MTLEGPEGTQESSDLLVENWGFWGVQWLIPVIPAIGWLKQNYSEFEARKWATE